MNIPISVEYLLSNLFGKHRYQGAVGPRSLATWKDDLVRIFTYVRKAIHCSVHGDDAHRQHMESRCDEAIADIKAVRNEDTANGEAIAALIGLCLDLLGGVPDNRDQQAPWNDSFWTLRRYRSLSYTRTPNQIVAHVLRCAELEGPNARPLYEDLANHLQSQSRGDARKFLAWYREKYPDRFVAEIAGR
jgi:hypothetical protein